VPQPRQEAAPQQAPAPAAPAEPADYPLPSLDEEFPGDTLYESDGGQVLRAGALTDRFYRRFGRMPTDTDMYILHIRREYERNLGRSPTKNELRLAIRRTYEAGAEETPI